MGNRVYLKTKSKEIATKTKEIKRFIRDYFESLY
jgi:hypothetical protein